MASGRVFRLRMHGNPRAVFQIQGAPVLTGQVTDAYTGFTCTTTGATGAVSFAATGFSTGVSIHATSGVVSGTPTQSGTFSVTITATDAGSGRQATLAFSLVIDALPVPTFAVADQTVYFGALSKSGAGYQVAANRVITAASIDSGNGSGHFAISSAGVLSVTSTGDTADLSGGTYTLGITCTTSDSTTDTATLTVNTSGNDAKGRALATAYHCRTNADFTTAIAAIGSAGGATVILRDGTFADLGTLSTVFASLVTIVSETYPATITTSADRTGSSIVEALVIDGAVKVKLQNIKFYKAQESLTTNNSAIGFINWRNSWDQITVYRCEFASSTIDKTAPLGDSGLGQDPLKYYPPGRYWRNGFIASNTSTQAGRGTNVTIQQCYFHDLVVAGTISIKDTNVSNTNVITENHVKDCYQLGIQFAGGSGIEVSWNHYEGLFSFGGDVNNPHQSWTPYTPSKANTGGSDKYNIEVKGNVFGPLPYRHSVISIAGIKIDDLEATTFRYKACKFHGNLVMATQSISIEMCNSDADCRICYNTLVHDTDFTTPGSPAVFLSGDLAGLAVVQNNYTSHTGSGASAGASGAAATTGVQLSGTPNDAAIGTGFSASKNLNPGNNLSQSPTYAATFDGPTFANVTDMLTTFNAKTGGPLKDTVTYGTYGCGATAGYVTWPAGFLTLPVAGTINGTLP